MPLSEFAKDTIINSRQEIVDVLRGKDKILIVVGPCSIHDLDAAKEYANGIKEAAEKVSDTFLVIMRTYFEKPRTSIGWKGLIYEPHLDGKENLNEGLRIARQLLKHNAELGLPSGTEFLDTVTPQYIDDFISWGAIGARTVGSPLHRQMASGLSMPIGFKNDTYGDVEIAANAVIAARQSQWFFGLDQNGTVSSVTTRGNQNTHIVLRGSDGATNYDKDSVANAQRLLQGKGLADLLMVDCSHGNSRKDYRMQPIVFEDVIKQICDGNNRIIGLMLESNLREGSQKIACGGKALEYGVSATDSCISLEATKSLLMDAHRKLKSAKGR